jgi:ferredoxin
MKKQCSWQISETIMIETDPKYKRTKRSGKMINCSRKSECAICGHCAAHCPGHLIRNAEPRFGLNPE